MLELKHSHFPSMTPEGPILLTGGSGLLGSAFLERLSASSLVVMTRADLDPVRPEVLTARIAELAPRVVLNCAADTDVEGAESDPARAFAVNAQLAGALARGAATVGARFIHFSSTGCYGDWKAEPYSDDDMLRPTTAHHRSKAEGERMVLEAYPAALVLRLGWVFGGRPEQRKNFVWQRLLEARGIPEIRSNPAQRGVPTFTHDIVEQVLSLLPVDISGVVNCVNAGEPTTRLGYVSAIMEAARLPVSVVPGIFNRKAPVSLNETARNGKLILLGLDRMPNWRASLTTYVRSLPPVPQRDVVK